jgi:signal transduction histidine kinase
MHTAHTVLIIDDEPIARAGLEALLARQGYRLEFADNGRAGLAKAIELLPDVVLLDIMMPDMDGYEVCAQLRADPRLRATPIVILTALSDKESLVRGLDAGADEFLTKPVTGLELRARVRSMLRIKQQHDELERLLQLREQFVNMLVHDMRSPLQVIMSYGDLLLSEAELSVEHREWVEAINANANRLSKLLTEMLITAKMAKGQFVLHRSVVDLGRLARDAWQQHRVIAQERRIELRLELPDQPVSAELDVNLFIRVLDNLLSNALKFSPPGSAVVLRVPPVAADGRLRIQVLDQGPGIPAAHLDSIFNQFEIVALRRKGFTQIGLGLPFCKLVVEAHGGRLQVEPHQPTGSIFTIELGEWGKSAATAGGMAAKPEQTAR